MNNGMGEEHDASDNGCLRFYLPFNTETHCNWMISFVFVHKTTPNKQSKDRIERGGVWLESGLPALHLVLVVVCVYPYLEPTATP